MAVPACRGAGWISTWPEPGAGTVGSGGLAQGNRTATNDRPGRLHWLDDLLLAGPDVPRLNLFCYVSERCRFFLNGQELTPSQSEPADYRARLGFEGLALKKGWNHLLFKVASTRLEGDGPATLAVRIESPSPEFFRQLESALELADSEPAPRSSDRPGRSQ